MDEAQSAEQVQETKPVKKRRRTVKKQEGKFLIVVVTEQGMVPIAQVGSVEEATKLLRDPSSYPSWCLGRPSRIVEVLGNEDLVVRSAGSKCPNCGYTINNGEFEITHIQHPESLLDQPMFQEVGSHQEIAEIARQELDPVGDTEELDEEPCVGCGSGLECTECRPVQSPVPIPVIPPPLPQQVVVPPPPPANG